MMVRDVIRLSMSMLVMYSQALCKAENRWISHPDQTTAVKEGSNVTLRWRYTLSSNIEFITFGLWRSSGYIDKKLLLVKHSGQKMVNSLVKGRMLFEGTLSNPGTAIIRILNVTMQDSMEYGLEIDMGLSRSSFKHSFKLLVYTHPASPRIAIQELVTNSHLRLLWQQPEHSHLFPIIMYTVWIRKNQSQWRISNTTLKESIVALWGEGRYEFGVTSRNRWAQSSLVINNTVTISRPTSATSTERAMKKTPRPKDIYQSNQTTLRTTQRTDPWHTTYETSTQPSPISSTTDQNKTQDSKGFFARFMTHILILVAVTILVVCGICLCVFVLRCRRRNRKGKINRTKKGKTKSKDTIISDRMYKASSTLTVDKESDEVEEELTRTPFTKFEVSCALHDNHVPSMMTFGQRSNSVKSSMTNQIPTDIEGGVHIYQEVDAAQGPALPPRNSIKRKQESMNKKKPSLQRSSSNKEKSTRRSKKYYREDSSGTKTCPERINGRAKGGEERTLDQKRSHNSSSPIYDNKSCDISTRKASSKRTKSTSSSMSCPVESDWELNPEDIHLCGRIGAGSFGQVWKGMIDGRSFAVKMLNDRANPSDRTDLLSELEVMKSLKTHPNVVKLEGCITMATVTYNGAVFHPPLVFLELVPYGDLLGYLRKSRGEDDDYYSGKDLKSPKRPTPQHLFSFAHDVAKGMAFLAENKIVHRDLAARNVLIGDRLRCKITDFGMARTLHDEDIYTKRSNGLFPVKWMAIESLLYQKYTTYSDVWSYGVVLYEIFTLGGRPYVGLSGLEVVELIKKGKRLSKPPHIYSKLYSLMLQCWAKNPNHRPDFSTLCRQITMLAKDHQRYLNLKEYNHQLYANVSTLT